MAVGLSFGYAVDDLAERITVGHGWQEAVAEMLRRQGFLVRSTPMKIRKEHESIEPYRHELDILVSLNGRLWMRVEVKSKGGYSDRFTGPGDWPYYDVTCYSTRKVDLDIPILLVSQATGGVVGLFDDGSERYDRDQPDSKRQVTYRVYAAPRRLLLSFDEWCRQVREYLEG